MNRTLFLTVAMAVLQAFAVAAQRQIDFSGTWAMEESRSESAVAAAASGKAIGPVTQVISRTDDKVTIQTESPELREALTYRTDGLESLDGGVKTSLRWEGLNLVTSTVRMISGMAVTTEQIRTLSPDGKEMVVDTTSKVEHGYNGVLAARGVFNGRDIFRRSPTEKR